MKKLTIDELTEEKNKAEEELGELFNSCIRRFEKKTGCTVVQASQHHKLFIYPNEPEYNYELFGFELHVKYNGQFIEIRNKEEI